MSNLMSKKVGVDKILIYMFDAFLKDFKAAENYYSLYHHTEKIKDKIE